MPEQNRRAIARRRPLNASREEIVAEEVADALAATPQERMQALIALLDSAYALWASRGFIAAVPFTQERRRGLCRDRRDGGAEPRAVSDDT